VGSQFHLPLIGPGGEPVSLRRTVRSHGLTELPPNRRHPEGKAIGFAVVIPGAGPRRVEISTHDTDAALVTISGRRLSGRSEELTAAMVRRMLCLDVDLSGFYRSVRQDRDLRWITNGAGRMMRSASVFEDVVKTICTTNCAWSGTERMVGAIVGTLGDDAGDGWRAFPSAKQMAEAPEAFYRDVARAGYRGPYLRTIAERAARGQLDLERLLAGHPAGLDDAAVRETLLALPGVGPYAASHIMMLLGRYQPLILDSWTRPTFARLSGETLDDRAIEARFARYGAYAGLAFWLYLTRDWVEGGDA